MKKIILILILVIELFGVDSEKIGIPYVEKGKGTIQSAVLDPDEKHFYTLKGETVTKWQLEPIKIIDSFKTGINQNDVRNGYHIDISNDSKKMIIRSSEKIMLWNLETKKLLKIINKETTCGTMNDLIYITINKNGEMLKWNIEQLSIIEKVHIKNYCDEVDNDSGHAPFCTIKSIHVESNKLITISKNLVLIFDKISFKVLSKIWIAGGNCRFSSDRKKLYCPKDYYGLTYIINLNDLNIEIKKKGNGFLFSPQVKKESYINFLSLKNNPIKKRYVLLNNKEKKGFYILQFDDNEWIIIQNNHFFKASGNAKKYLKMKTKKRKIIPINNATYKKYNTKIKIKG